VIALANTHSRVHLLDPGPGVGGYCIPNALHYLRPLAERVQVALPTLEAARQTNAQVPERIVGVALAHLRAMGVEPGEGRFAVWGLAMKDYTNDDRISPPVEVAQRLAATGAEVRAFDPAVRADHPFPAASALEATQGAHALLVLARQEGMDFDDDAPLRALQPGAIVIDTRGAYRRQEERLRTLGLVYWSI
jgi:UDP-N-acetyl-D-mannosaminuronic acid dehydrogenase